MFEILVLGGVNLKNISGCWG